MLGVGSDLNACLCLTPRSPAASPGEDCSGSSADLLFAAATPKPQEAAAAGEDDGQDQWQCGHATAE